MAGIPARVTGIFTMILGANCENSKACSIMAFCIPVKPRIRLNRKPAVPTFLLLEDWFQKVSRFDRDLSNNLPTDLVLGRHRHFRDQTPNPILPISHLFLQHADNHDWVTSSCDRAMLAGIG